MKIIINYNDVMHENLSNLLLISIYIEIIIDINKQQTTTSIASITVEL